MRDCLPVFLTGRLPKTHHGTADGSPLPDALTDGKMLDLDAIYSYNNCLSQRVKYNNRSIREEHPAVEKPSVWTEVFVTVYGMSLDEKVGEVG